MTVVDQFIQGIDYGPRSGTEGWNIHMAEGNNPAAWLARKPGEDLWEWADRVNGVSCNFAINRDGKTIQQVAWGHAAGNLNPDDRSTNKAFYGRRFLLEVLPVHWANPNEYTLSIELAGFAVDGPTDRQIEAVVDLVAEGQRRYPSIRGAFGHADQTNTKGCPGVSSSMRALWDRIGHGRFITEADMPGLKVRPIGETQSGTVAIPEGTEIINMSTKLRTRTTQGSLREATGQFELEEIAGVQVGYLAYMASGYSWMRASDVTFAPDRNDAAHNAALEQGIAALEKLKR